MAEKNSNPAFIKFLESLSENDREWFEERLSIIQFSQGQELTEIEAGRIAFKCLKTHNERKAA